MRRAYWLSLMLVVPLAVLGGVSAQATPTTGGTVFLTTAPAIGGVRLDVDGQIVTTRQDGSATVAVARLSGIAARTSLAGSPLGGRNTVTLARVSTEANSPRHQSHLIVSLNVFSQVSLRLDPGTTGIAATTVHAVRLRSITGQVMTVDPQRTRSVTLLSRQSRLVGGTPQSQVVTWTVDSARAGPGVSVATARTRFDPFTSSVWTLRLQPVRGTVIVDTVPRVAGVVFSLDGATFSTDTHGRATAVVEDLNAVGGRLTLSTPQAGTNTVSIVQVTKQRSSTVFQRQLMVALNVSRPVSLAFRDPSGTPVSPSRITEVQLAGGGTVLTLTGLEVGHPVMLLSMVTRLVGSAWQAQQVRYAVMGVRIDGGEAVFTGQQRFDPNSSAVWPVSVAVFDVSVVAHDALFGSLVGLSTWITRPDGSGFEVVLDGDGPTTVASLVRGNYDIQAKAGPLGSDTKVVVSRNQVVDLRVVTTLDLLVVAGAVVGLAILLVLLGRYALRRQLRTAGERRTAGVDALAARPGTDEEQDPMRQPALAGTSVGHGSGSATEPSVSEGPSVGNTP